MSSDTPAKSRWILLALLGGLFLGNLDIAVVNTAIPEIERSLRIAGSGSQLIVSAYTLAYAVFLMPAAQLSHRLGTKRCYLVGVLGFTAASLACGVAGSWEALVGARAVQGGFAALMVTQVLTAVQHMFSGELRRRALGAYTAVLGGSSVVGQATGGLLVSADILGAGWRPIFWVNIPVGLVITFVVLRYMPAERARPSRVFDVPGLCLLAVTLVSLVLPLSLIEGSPMPAWSWALLALAVVSGAGLWWVELIRERAGNTVLVSPGLLTRRAVAFALASQAMTRAAYFGMLFATALYLQDGRGQSPAAAGLIPVAWVATFAAVGPVLNKIGGRIRRWAGPAGGLFMCLGFAGAAAATTLGPLFTLVIVVAFALGGVGYGAAFGGTMTHLTDRVERSRAAEVSGLFNTVLQVGGSLGVAAFGSTYKALAAGSTPDAAFAVTCAAMCLLSALASLAMLVAARAPVGRFEAYAFEESGRDIPHVRAEQEEKA